MREQGQGIRTTAANCFFVTARDYSTAQFHRQYRAFSTDLRGKIIKEKRASTLRRTKSEQGEAPLSVRGTTKIRIRVCLQKTASAVVGDRL
jgi:hypothetical protein